MRFDMPHQFCTRSIYRAFCARLGKHCRVTLFVCLPLAVVMPTVHSFAQANTAGAAPQHVARKRPTIDDRVKVLAKNLDLNESQQTAVKKILERRHQETLRIQRDPTIAGSARIEQFRMLQDRTAEQISAVLTEEQRKKYDPFAARRIPQSEGRTVEDWLKVTTPK